MENNMKHTATIVSIEDEARVKKGSGKLYLLATVKFMDGVLEGKTAFAQRTLGANKSAIHVGQQVTTFVSSALDPVTGNTKVFFEISTGASVTSNEELLDLLGL